MHADGAAALLVGLSKLLARAGEKMQLERGGHTLDLECVPIGVVCSDVRSHGPRVERERRPHAETASVPGVSGVEVWRCFDWYEAKVYCFPCFTFTAPVDPSIPSLSYHYRRRHKSISSGMLMMMPNRSVRVGDITTASGSGDRPTLLGLVVPISILTDGEQQQLAASNVDIGQEGMARTRATTELICSLMAGDLSPSLKEEKLRAFVLHALAETFVSSERGAAGCLRSVQRARDFVHVNVASQFSLDDVARETQLTKWHLARSFRAQMGVSIGEYARHVRGHEALRLLKAGRKPSEVAAELGYSDQPHLTRELRALFGFTPARYARSHAAARSLAHAHASRR